MSELFKVTKVNGKGFGVIAIQDIPKCTLILKEKAQLICPRTSSNPNMFESINNLQSAFDKMDKNDQKEFLNLHCGRETQVKIQKIWEIFQNNKFEDSHFRENEIVGLKTSRFNHSCRPVAYYEIDWEKRNYTIEIKSSEDIAAGQEITIDYHGKLKNFFFCYHFLDHLPNKRCVNCTYY